MLWLYWELRKERIRSAKGVPLKTTRQDVEREDDQMGEIVDALDSVVSESIGGLPSFDLWELKTVWLTSNFCRA